MYVAGHTKIFFFLFEVTVLPAENKNRKGNEIHVKQNVLREIRGIKGYKGALWDKKGKKK